MFLSLLYTLSLASALFEGIEEIQSTTSQDLVQSIEDPDYLSMIIIYDDISQGSFALEKVLLEVAPKYSNYVKFYKMHCDDQPDLCTNELKSQLPAFQGYVPAGLNPYTGKPLVHQRPYQGIIGVKEVNNFLNENIPYLGEYLSSQSNGEFIAEPGNKVILFTNKEKVPILYKALTSKFRGRLDFGVIWQNQTEMIKHYDIKEFPSLVVVEKDDVINYNGKIEFNAISDFLEKFKSDSKRAPKVKKPQAKPVENEAKLPEFPIIKLKKDNVNDYLFEDTGLYLVHFYKDKASAEWEDIKSDYNGIIKLAEFYCKTKEDQDVCQSFGVKKYPSMRMFPVNRKRKSFELTFDTRAELEEEITRELRHDIMTIQEATVQTFIQSVQEEQKVGVILVADSYLPLQYKGIASEIQFKDFVKFGYFNRPKEQALSIFSIKNFPSIMAFGLDEASGELKVVEYTGTFEDYKTLYYFIDQVSIPMFSGRKSPQISEEDQEEIDIIRTTQGLNSKCLKKTGICVIGLFEGEPDYESKQYKTLKSVKAIIDSRKIPVSFVALDAMCQYELREAFGISEISLPNIAAFTTSKKKGSRLVGKYNVDDITGFIEGVLRGKLEIFDVPALEYVERDCQSLFSTEEDSENDDILEEILKGAEHKGEIHKSSDTKRGRRKRSRNKSEL